MRIDNPDAGDATAEYQQFGDTPGGLHVEVQKVSHPSRVHLDIEADDVDAEADRLERLGARKIGFVKRWGVMDAPSGQRFCVVKTNHHEKGQRPNEWPLTAPGGRTPRSLAPAGRRSHQQMGTGSGNTTCSKPPP